MTAASTLTTEDLLASAWREAWRPPDRRPPWLWGEHHIKSIPYSPIPAAFRSEHSPWIREPLEAMVDNAIPCVSIMACIQAGKTTVAEIGACYIIANMPGPMLWLDQTDDDAKDQSESRLLKLFDECPPVKRLFHRNRHKKKLDAIHFAHGMALWVLGAHNKTNLQRRSIRWVIGDETWRWPAGHMAEAEARVTAFGWLGKCLFVSQGGEEGDDTDKKWKSGDQREWTFACPHCQTRQPFLWRNVEWSKEAHDGAEWDFEHVKRTTVLLCDNKECRHEFRDNSKTRKMLNASGGYVAMNPKASGQVVSFHWNSLCASSWGMLAELYLRAKETAKRGDLTDLKIFYQKRLALSWREDLEDFKADIKASSYQRRQPWANEGAISLHGDIISAPLDRALVAVPLRFLTVDVQLDHFWCLARSWAGNGSSRLVEWRKCQTWEDVEAMQAELGIAGSLVFIDARHSPGSVYKKCGENGWTALMGDKRAMFQHKTKGKGKVINRYYSTRRKVAPGGKPASLFYWSNLSIKDMLARLRLNQDPLKGITWEIPEDAGDEYLQQLDSERRVKRGDRWIWEQIGKRHNHLWDCEAMQVVAATMLKIIGRESIPQEEGPEDAGAEA